MATSFIARSRSPSSSLSLSPSLSPPSLPLSFSLSLSLSLSSLFCLTLPSFLSLSFSSSYPPSFSSSSSLRFNLSNGYHGGSLLGTRQLIKPGSFLVRLSHQEDRDKESSASSIKKELQNSRFTSRCSILIVEPP